MRSSFPPGWAATTIGDVFEIVGGSTPRTDNPDYWDGEIPWLTPDDLSTHQGVQVSRGRRSITEAGFASTSTHMLPKNSILFSSRAPIGYTAVAANPLCTNQGFKSLIPPAGVESRYVYWYLRHATPTIRELGSGTTFRELSKKRMNAVPFVLAPTAEQGRIATATEEHFSRLDAVDNALTAAQRRLDALLQSALRSSCEGSWATRPLSDIIKSLKNGVFVSRPTAKPPGYPIYRISAVRPLQLRVDDIRYASPVPDGASAYAVEAGDVLFTRYSGNPNYVGAAAVVLPDGVGVLHPDKLIRVIVDRDRVLPEWIAAYVTAGTGRREVEQRLKTTAGQVGISGSQLRTVPIAVPPISYQQQAVDKIAAVLAERERLRQTLSAVEVRVEALRRSILSEAFAGQLVPQDPSDEHASLLLERIAASRSTKPNCCASARQMS